MADFFNLKFLKNDNPGVENDEIELAEMIAFAEDEGYGFYQGGLADPNDKSKRCAIGLACAIKGEDFQNYFVGTIHLGNDGNRADTRNADKTGYTLGQAYRTYFLEDKA